MLLDVGERPAILSRGYARQTPSEGVVIVSDGRLTKTDVAHAGDEAFMLARAVPGAAVLVSASRYLAGRMAETQLGCTVHILDDGFQHFQLMRDIDLLVTPDALEDVQTLPFGRFREPLDAARAADALLVPMTDGADVSAMSERLGVTPAFGFSRRLDEPRPLDSLRSLGAGWPADSPVPMRAFAFAGIARPERFYSDLERSGWQLTGRRSFRDHHHYHQREIDNLAREARDSGADVILTTEKDAVRLPVSRGADPRGHQGGQTPLPIAFVPLQISLEPAFSDWLRDRLRAIRSLDPGAPTPRSAPHLRGAPTPHSVRLA